MKTATVAFVSLFFPYLAVATCPSKLVVQDLPVRLTGVQLQQALCPQVTFCGSNVTAAVIEFDPAPAYPYGYALTTRFCATDQIIQVGQVNQCEILHPSDNPCSMSYSTLSQPTTIIVYSSSMFKAGEYILYIQPVKQFPTEFAVVKYHSNSACNESSGYQIWGDTSMCLSNPDKNSENQFQNVSSLTTYTYDASKPNQCSESNFTQVAFNQCIPVSHNNTLLYNTVSQFSSNFLQVVFNYYPDQSCSNASPTRYYSFFQTLGGGIIGNFGLLQYNEIPGDQPLAYLFYLNSAGTLITEIYNAPSVNYTAAQLILSITSLPGVCNPPNAYMPNYYTFTIFGPSPITTLNYIGQVNLNAAANSLNAQIVGSSVGVICGFTFLTIVLSMFLE